MSKEELFFDIIPINDAAEIGWVLRTCCRELFIVMNGYMAIRGQ